MYKLENLELEGCLKIFYSQHNDNRGSNRKIYQKSLLSALGIETDFKEILMTVSKKNVIRGMHYQESPHEQVKLIQCLRGSFLDVILDLRTESKTFGKSQAITVTENDNFLLFLPHGIAHGYQSLEEGTITLYNMSREYNPQFENGIKWDSFGFKWSIEGCIISERDQSFQTFEEFKRNHF